MLLLLTFLLIFGWKINSWLDISAMLALALVIFHLCSKGVAKKNRLAMPTASLIALVIYSTSVVLLTGITDLQPILRAGRALVVLLAGFSLFDIYKNKYNNPEYKITEHIFISLVIHSLIMIAMYCSNDFLNFIYSFTNVFAIVNESGQIREGFRICGLTYSLSQTSVLQLFGLIILPYIWQSNQQKQISISDSKSATIIQYLQKPYKSLLFLSGISLFVSIIISGRSGLFIGFIYLIFTIIYYLYKFKFSFNNFSKNRKYIIRWLFIVISAVIILINILPEKFINYSLFYAKEIFQVFANKSVTVDNLKVMFFLPESLMTTIFGCGNYGRTESFYLPSDVGYIKSIFAIGIIGTIFMLIPFIWSINAAFKNRNKLSIIIVLIFLASLILNFKELSLLTRNQWTIQAILIALLNYFNNSKENNFTKQ